MNLKEIYDFIDKNKNLVNKDCTDIINELSEHKSFMINMMRSCNFDSYRFSQELAAFAMGIYVGRKMNDFILPNEDIAK